MTGEEKRAFAARISQANQTALVVIIYEMTICYLDDALRAQAEDDQVLFDRSIEKTRACINELLGSLHTEYEMARNMMSLYIYCLKGLVHAAQRRDKETLLQIRSILERLHRAYATAVKEDSSPALMSGAQNLYEGLTYGKNGMATATSLYK